MALFVPFATRKLERKPYAEGFMWVDVETGMVRFDIDGKSVYAASGSSDYNELENQPIYNISDLLELKELAANHAPLYIKWSGENNIEFSSTSVLQTDVIYFIEDQNTARSLTGAKPISDYNDLENTPIKTANLNDPETTLEASTYYLNKDIINAEIDENPTNPTRATLNNIYFNKNIPVDEIGYSFYNLDWDNADYSLPADHDMQFSSIQLLGADVNVTPQSAGIFVNRMHMVGSDSTPEADVFMICNYCSPNPERDGVANAEVFFTWSRDIAATDFELENWGWSSSVDSDSTVLNVTLTRPFEFNVIGDNKEVWDSYLSITDKFSLPVTYAPDLLYYHDKDKLRKIDGNVIEPVDQLQYCRLNDVGKIVYNKADRNLYECIEDGYFKPTSLIDWEILADESFSNRVEWDSSTPLQTLYINTKEYSDQLIESILLGRANDACGTRSFSILTYYADSSSSTAQYSSTALDARFSNDRLNIYDYSDGSSSDIIFDASGAGWSDKVVKGPDYATYTFSKPLSRTHLGDHAFDPYYLSGIFSYSPDKFTDYPIISDGIYFNIKNNPRFNDIFISDELKNYPIIMQSISGRVENTAAIGYLIFASAGVLTHNESDLRKLIIIDSVIVDGDSSQSMAQRIVYSEDELSIDGAAIPRGWNSDFVDPESGRLLHYMSNSSSYKPYSEVMWVGPVQETINLGNAAAAGADINSIMSGDPYELIIAGAKWKSLEKVLPEYLLATDGPYSIRKANPTGESINGNSTVPNLILIGDVSGTLTIGSGSNLRNLVYVGKCDNLTIDTTAYGTYWSEGRRLPKISIYGSGTALVRGDIFDIESNTSLTVNEVSDSIGTVKYNQVKCADHLIYNSKVGGGQLDIQAKHLTLNAPYSPSYSTRVINAECIYFDSSASDGLYTSMFDQSLNGRVNIVQKRYYQRISSQEAVNQASMGSTIGNKTKLYPLSTDTSAYVFRNIAEHLKLMRQEYAGDNWASGSSGNITLTEPGSYEVKFEATVGDGQTYCCCFNVYYDGTHKSVSSNQVLTSTVGDSITANVVVNSSGKLICNAADNNEVYCRKIRSV